MRYLGLGIILAAALITNPTQASLIGDTVHGNFQLDPNITVVGTPPPPENLFDSLAGSGSTAVVDLGPEFVYDGTEIYIAADLSGETLILDYIWQGPIQTPLGPLTATIPRHFLEFTDLDWVGAPGTIVGFNLVSGSTPILASYGHGADSLLVQFDEFVLDAPGSFHLEFDIEVQHNTTPPIPEPATLTLMGLGIAGLAYRRRKSC